MKISALKGGERLQSTRRALLAIAVPIIAMLSIGAAYADYPKDPIRLIVPWPVGGSNDLVGRVFAEALGNKLGTAVVVDNKTGANGIIGTANVSKASADGYTLLFTSSEPLTVNPGIYSDLPYDVTKQLDTLALVARTHFVIAANKEFPADDIKSAVALAKQHPKKYSFGSYGIADMFLAYYEKTTDTDYLRVPYRGAAPALTATLAGTVDMTLVATSTALSTGNKIKILGVGSKQRIDTMPEVPTFIEQGLTDFEIGNWLSLSAPTGLPPDIRDKLVQATDEIANSPSFKQRLVDVGIHADYMAGKQLQDLIHADTDRWTKLAVEKNLQAN